VTTDVLNPFSRQRHWSSEEINTVFLVALRINLLRFLRERRERAGKSLSDLPDPFVELFPNGRASSATRRLLSSFSPFNPVRVRFANLQVPFGSSASVELHLTSRGLSGDNEKVDTKEGFFTWQSSMVLNADRAACWDFFSDHPQLFIAGQVKAVQNLTLNTIKYEYVKAMGCRRAKSARIDLNVTFENGATAQKRSSKSKANFHKRAAALDTFYGDKEGLFVMVYTGAAQVPEDALPDGMVLVSLEDLQGTLLLSPDAEDSTVLEAKVVEGTAG
jgi:hypothetical protein